ncbi:MAG: hypothetical protein R3A79_08290 [Nannocystaceae bacterium]
MDGRRWRGSRCGALLLVLMISGCVEECLADAENARFDEGQPCASNRDCSSGDCSIYNLCEYRACDCGPGGCGPEGAANAACDDDWRCVDDPDRIAELADSIGGGASVPGVCLLPCATRCSPPTSSCVDGFCHPEPYWDHPEVTITWPGSPANGHRDPDAPYLARVESGATLHVRAFAEALASATPLTYAWTLDEGEGSSSTAATDAVDVTVPAWPGALTATLVVTDAEGRPSEPLTVIFAGCEGQGVACVEGDEKCCYGCGAGALTCL